MRSDWAPERSFEEIKKDLLREREHWKAVLEAYAEKDKEYLRRTVADIVTKKSSGTRHVKSQGARRYGYMRPSTSSRMAHSRRAPTLVKQTTTGHSQARDPTIDTSKMDWPTPGGQYEARAPTEQSTDALAIGQATEMQSVQEDLAELDLNEEGPSDTVKTEDVHPWLVDLMSAHLPQYRKEWGQDANFDDMIRDMGGWEEIISSVLEPKSS